MMKTELSARTGASIAASLLMLLLLVHTTTQAQSPDHPTQGLELLDGTIEISNLPVASVDTIQYPPRIDTGRIWYQDGDRLEWGPVQEADSYHLQISATPDFTSGKIEIIEEMGAPAPELVRDVENISNTWYTIDVDTGGTYYWRVRAVDQFFVPGPWSVAAEFQLSVSSVTTLKESDLRAGPNPCFSCTYRIHSEASPIKNLKIYNLSGQIVITDEYAEGVSNLSLDLSTLSSGLYIVTTTQVDGSVVGRRVVVE